MLKRALLRIQPRKAVHATNATTQRNTKQLNENILYQIGGGTTPLKSLNFVAFVAPLREKMPF